VMMMVIHDLFYALQLGWWLWRVDGSIGRGRMWAMMKGPARLFSLLISWFVCVRLNEENDDPEVWFPGRTGLSS
jgi:hypothetical protein